MNAQLVVIKNERVQQVVTALLEDMQSESSYYTNRNVWIGLSRKNSTSTWRWADQSKIRRDWYVNWASDSPNNDIKADCVEVYLDYIAAGQWHNLDCLQSRNYICQRRMFFQQQIIKDIKQMIH